MCITNICLSGAGKTQFLLSLLLSAQLPPPCGLSRPTLYISTEHPLPTTRLAQILSAHPKLALSTPDLSPLFNHEDSTATTRPSLSRIFTLQTPDLESQDHILTYQLPVALERHNIGLVIIDSIAANYRAEMSSHATNTTNDRASASVTASGPTSGLNAASNTRGASLAHRSSELIRLGQLLRNLARDFNVAIVVANQVADRFSPLPPPRVGAENQSRVLDLRQQHNLSSSPTLGALAQPSSSASTSAFNSEALIGPSYAPDDGGAEGPAEQNLFSTPISTILSLDHQQRWFTGWGDSPSSRNPKTPSLGLVWSNQIACRIALLKEPAYLSHMTHAHLLSEDMQNRSDMNNENEITGEGSAEWAPRHWRRWMRVVYAPWVQGVGEGEPGVEIEVWAGGVRSLSKARGRE